MQLSVIKASAGMTKQYTSDCKSKHLANGGDFDELLKCVNQSFLVPSFKKNYFIYDDLNQLI